MRTQEELLDAWSAEEAARCGTEWAAPLMRLLRRAKGEGWSLTRVREELRRVEFNTDALVRGLVRAQQVGMGIGIREGEKGGASAGSSPPPRGGARGRGGGQ